MYKHLIADINECTEYNGGCQHNCTNTNSSYSCSCKDGYKLNEHDNHNCTEFSACERLHCALIAEITAPSVFVILCICLIAGMQGVAIYNICL